MDENENALTPLHPNHVKVTRIVALLYALPVLVAVMAGEFALRQMEEPFLRTGTLAIPVLILLAILVLRVPLRRYHARGYDMAGDRLRVVRGIMFHSDTVVPFGRIQHIDVHQGPLQRAFGLATLTVHTAGTHNASVHLPGLANDTAMEMRETIRSHIKRETV